MPQERGALKLRSVPRPDQKARARAEALTGQLAEAKVRWSTARYRERVLPRARLAKRSCDRLGSTSAARGKSYAQYAEPKVSVDPDEKGNSVRSIFNDSSSTTIYVSCSGLLAEAAGRRGWGQGLQLTMGAWWACNTGLGLGAGVCGVVGGDKGIWGAWEACKGLENPREQETGFMATLHTPTFFARSFQGTVQAKHRPSIF